MICLQITAPHFCAGLVLSRHGFVVEAAPILRYMLGWKRAVVQSYASSKGWTVYQLKESPNV